MDGVGNRKGKRDDVRVLHLGRVGSVEMGGTPE